MKKTLIAYGIAAVLSFGAAASAQETTIPNNAWKIAGLQIGNPLDSSTWWDGSVDIQADPKERIDINPMDPDFWMQIPSPELHSRIHTALLNPANWAQFAKPATYVKMADTDVLIKWFQPSTYAVLVDPQTYIYRMQPGAYVHELELRTYMQLFNPSAYWEIADTALNTAGLSFVADAGGSLVKSLFN